jgi:hypothetical protein
VSQTPESALAWRKRVRVDRYATVFAHVVHFGTERTEEVLGRFGLSVADWQALDAAWSTELAEVVRRQQSSLAMRFSSTFFRVRGELTKRQPALSSVGEPVLREAPPVAMPPPAVPMARALLSYELAERLQSALKAQSHTPVPLEPTWLPSLPSTSSAPAAGHISVPKPSTVPAFLAETGDLDDQAILRGPNLPFSKGQETAERPLAADSLARREAALRPSQSSGEVAPQGQGTPGIPFGFASAEGSAGLLLRFPLARYAEISLSLARGEDKANIFVRNELTETTWRALATAWAERLQQDPQLRSQFHEHVKELRSRR